MLPILLPVTKMITTSSTRIRAFVMNFAVGIAIGFVLSYMYLGDSMNRANQQVRPVRTNPVSSGKHVHKDEHVAGDEFDPHDEETIDGVSGPEGDVKFHSGSEMHHQGIFHFSFFSSKKLNAVNGKNNIIKRLCTNYETLLDRRIENRQFTGYATRMYNVV